MGKGRYITKYRAWIGGPKEDKEIAERILGSALPGVETYDLIEPNVWALERTGGFSEEEITQIANKIVENAPKSIFYIDIMRYDRETTAKLIDFRIGYQQDKMRILRDMI